MDYVFVPPGRPSLPVAGGTLRFPLRRIYCVGRNYRAHAAEMGMRGEEAPFFFSKPPDAAFVPEGVVPYPPATRMLHHEVELVVALGRGGVDIDRETAMEHVFGFAVGIDLTRRDLQQEARAKGRPWDMGKGFSFAAPCTPVHRREECFAGDGVAGAIRLAVDGALRQDGRLEEMIYGVAEILAELSRLDRLAAGDLVFTGTPAGVGELRRGNRVRAEIERVGVLEFRVGN